MRLIAAWALGAALLPAQSQAVFGLFLQANGGDGAPLYRGEPALVEVMLSLEEGGAAKVAFRDGAPWTAGLKLALTNRAGAPVQAEWQRLGAAESALEFTAMATEIHAVFALDPAAVAALPPGEYTLSATFEAGANAAAGAWRGKASAPALRLAVSGEPREAAPAAQTAKRRLEARWKLLSGRGEEALADLDAALALAPGDVRLLEDKAGALMELGRGGEAAETLRKAIAAFRKQNPGEKHPPRELLRMLREADPF